MTARKLTAADHWRHALARFTHNDLLYPFEFLLEVPYVDLGYYLAERTVQHLCRRIILRSPTTAVIIEEQTGDGRVDLARVRPDGSLPPIGASRPTAALRGSMERFDLRWLIDAREPELLVRIDALYNDPHHTDAQLILCGRFLQERGSDVLRGEFTVFAELDRRLRAHLMKIGQLR